LQRAQQGDTTVLPELRAVLDTRRDLWQEVGDLACHAELTMVRLVAGENLFMQEAVLRRLAELKKALAGDSPSPLERLLVDRIGVCWLQTHHADLDAASARVRDQGASSVSLYAQRRLDSAHRRYLLAVKQLTLVRKLLGPGGKKPPAPQPDFLMDHGAAPKGEKDCDPRLPETDNA
jgi:hypothetical protein